MHELQIDSLAPRRLSGLVTQGDDTVNMVTSFTVSYGVNSPEALYVTYSDGTPQVMHIYCTCN